MFYIHKLLLWDRSLIARLMPCLEWHTFGGDPNEIKATTGCPYRTCDRNAQLIIGPLLGSFDRFHRMSTAPNIQLIIKLTNRLFNYGLP